MTTRKFKFSAALGVALAVLAGSALVSSARADDKTIIVYDGDTADKGGGWSVPKEAPNGSIAPNDKEVKAGKKSIAFHAKGTGWSGCGWNWQGWYPADAGTDISAADKLSFWIKLTGDKKPASLAVHLNSNNNKATPDVKIEAYLKKDEKLDDGAWHEIIIPLKDMYGDKKDFDPKAAWEIGLGAYGQDELDYTVYLDTVQFLKP